jgi:hypothetical protein
MNRYDEVVMFINKNMDVIKSIFQAVLQYQIETYKLTNISIDFDFKLVDQNGYINELK